MFYKLLHKAYQPCHGDEAVCIIPGLTETTLHPKIWSAELLPYVKLRTTPCTTW